MRICMLVLGGALLLTWPAFSATYTIRPDGTGDFPTIQAAIDDPAVLAGDILALIDGTYTGDGNRDIDLDGKDLVIRSISGAPELCILDCQRSSAAPHRGFVFHNGESAASVVEGVDIINGWISYHTPGSAIRCENGSAPTIINCRMIDCHGSALGCEQGGSPRITDCSFDRNHGDHGGAILIRHSSAAIEGCKFSENTTTSGGAAILCTASTMTINACNIFGNVAGGQCSGVMITDYAAATITDCVFLNNTSTSKGALQLSDHCTAEIRGASIGKKCRAVFEHCTFYGNGSSYYAGGLAIAQDAGASIDNCIIAFSLEGSAIQTESEEVYLTCTDIFGNPGGDWIGKIASQYGLNGNISEDPLLCDPENYDYSLAESSPCAPFTPPNPECDLSGAWPIGCGGTAVDQITWGGLKALFR